MPGPIAHFCSLVVDLYCIGRTDAQANSIYRILNHKYQEFYDSRAERGSHMVSIRICGVDAALQSQDRGSEDEENGLEIEDEDEDDDEYADGLSVRSIENALLEVADWLLSRPKGAFKKCRELELILRLRISPIWIEEYVEYLELYLPAKLLRACGQAEIEISIDACAS
jgi:hypothetical protein